MKFIRLNADLLEFKKGEVVEFERLRPDHKSYFERRIEDAKIDNCVEVFEENPVTKQDSKPATSKKKASEKEAK